MRQPELKTAREVSEYLLKVTADGLMQRDFDHFASAFGLPHTMTTAQREIRLSSREELHSSFQQMCAHFQTQRVTKLRRVCEAAEFHGPDRVKATHISHLVTGDGDAVPPYPVFSVLERLDGLWKITSSDYALSGADPKARALCPFESRDQEAKAIYQEHLDRTTDSLMRRDFAKFRQGIQLPHTMTTETDTQIVTTIDEMQEVFHRFADKYDGIGVTDFVRVAKDAYYYADNEIRGVHESHLIRHGTRLIPPYPNRIRLIRGDDGSWRETHSANAMLNTSDRIHLWAEVSSTPQLPDLDIDPERTSND